LFRGEGPPPGSPQADEARIKEFVSSVKVDLQAAVNQVVKDELLLLRDELMTAIDKKREVARSRQPEPLIMEAPHLAETVLPPKVTEPVRTAQLPPMRFDAHLPTRSQSRSKSGEFTNREGFMIVGALVAGIIAGILVASFFLPESQRPTISTTRLEPDPGTDRARVVVTQLLEAQAGWPEFLHSKKLIDLIGTIEDAPAVSTKTGKIVATYKANPASLRTGDEADLILFVLQRTLNSSSSPDDILQQLETAFLTKTKVTIAELEQVSPDTSADQWIRLLGRAFLMEAAR